MLLARRVILLAAIGAATFAMTASAASAQIEVLHEDGEHCEPVELLQHLATGGCFVELKSTGEVPLYANLPGVGVVALSNCEWHLLARIGEDGAGWVFWARLTGHPAPSVPCLREPCDEFPPSHVELMWPLQIEESNGQATLELTYCTRHLSTPEGEGHIACRLHIPVSDLGNHEIELGTEGGSVESHCEPGLPFDVWVTNAHFRYEVDSDRIEIVH